MSDPLHIVLLRHAETDWNSTGRLTSTTDLDLSAKGRGQAKRICKSLNAMKPTNILSSPAARAMQTIAPYTTETGINILSDNRLREVDFGIYEGRVGDECRRQVEFRHWESGEIGENRVAEPLAEAANRIKIAIEEFITCGQSDAIIVTHGVLLRLFLVSEVLQLPLGTFRRLRIDNARAAIVCLDNGKWRLAGLNIPPGGIAEWCEA